MAEAPLPLNPRPKGNGAETRAPKPPLVHTALGGRTFAQYKALPHHCIGLPTSHAGPCCQMGSDNQRALSLTYERLYGAEFDKDYLVGKCPKS